MVVSFVYGTDIVAPLSTSLLGDIDLPLSFVSRTAAPLSAEIIAVDSASASGAVDAVVAADPVVGRAVLLAAAQRSSDAPIAAAAGISCRAAAVDVARSGSCGCCRAILRSSAVERKPFSLPPLSAMAAPQHAGAALSNQHQCSLLLSQQH